MVVEEKTKFQKILDGAKDLAMLLSFAFGLFRSTPEGRARRAFFRKEKAIDKWRSKRQKYSKELRKDLTENRITETEYSDLMQDYDKSYPRPE